MSWYKEYKSEWKEIIETISREVNRTPQMIEKDTIQSMFLLELSKLDLSFVFKGGTSLSKGYGLIDRFSEDIDLSMNVKPTESEKKKSKAEIERIANSLGMVLDNPEDIQSRHLYDIAKILPHIELNKEIDELIDDVRNDRMLSKNNPSAQLDYNIPEMLQEIINSRFYESDYNNITKKLLYEDVSYDEAIQKGISVIAQMDIFEYKK